VSTIVKRACLELERLTGGPRITYRNKHLNLTFLRLPTVIHDAVGDRSKAWARQRWRPPV